MDSSANPFVRPVNIDQDNLHGVKQEHDSGQPATTTTNKEEIVVNAETQSALIDSENSFPDGGLRAWLVVAGAWLCLYPSFGLMVSIGPIQDYLHQNQLSNYTSRDVAWIPGVFVYIALALGIWVGPLFDRYGPRWLAIGGSVGYIVMIFLLAECKVYWQFMLCLGILGGITGAALTTIALACVSHWFKERRALTQGIAMTGNSVGGLTIPLILRATFPRYGFVWSMRILGFIFAAFLVAGNLLLRARIPPSKKALERKIISFAIFSDLRLSLLTIAIFCLEMVLFGALGIIPTYASISTSYPPGTGFYLIAIMNGVSSVSRVVSGFLADKAGRFNTLGVSIIVALIAIAAIWLPFGDKSLGALYGFITIFGICTGTWMSLVPPCIGQLCRADEFGRYFGSCYFLASISTLICIPISGELAEAVSAQAMILFYLAILVLGGITFGASRWACLGWKWDWTTKV